MAEENVKELHRAEASDPATSAQRLETLSADADLRGIVASNPAAPASLLERLSRYYGKEVCRAVAGNPNTPWHVLERLAKEFPNEFLSNPIMPLHMAIDPEQIKISDPVWDHLFWKAELPSLWWNWLRSRPASKVSPAVRLQVQYAGETTYCYGEPQTGEEHLLLTLLELLTAALVQGASLPAFPASTPAGRVEVACEQIVGQYFQRLALSPDEKVRRVIAGNPQTPVELVRTLAQDQDSKVRRHVASNPQTPVEALFALAQDQDSKVRRHVASNPQTPPELLRTLANDPYAGVRGDIASNVRTPVGVLRTLARDQRAGVRQAVARNPQTPVAVLFTLALDQRVRVRRAVARNIQVPIKALRLLAFDRGVQVRRAVVQHPQTPVDVLRTLVLDGDRRVSEWARWKSRLWQKDLTRKQVEGEIPLREQEAQQQRNRLLYSAEIRYESIEKQLDSIAHLDASEDVRGMIVAGLATDWDYRISRNFSLYRAYSASELHAARRYYRNIMVPFMPAIALQKLATSPSWEVRYLVALHERTPQDMRQRLSQDGNRYVRAMARATQMGRAAPTE